uniref:ShKT domain-containing protein n=1 Tax=Rhabditophanes sp. KR3021 TaxID=114890 RepID=A0AC35U1P8_9BILA
MARYFWGLRFIFLVIFVGDCGGKIFEKADRFRVKARNNLVLLDETESSSNQPDYEFLLSRDSEDDFGDIYDQVYQKLPDHEVVFMGKSIGLKDSNGVTAPPTVTKVPHPRPPVLVPQFFRTYLEKAEWLNTLQDTLFPITDGPNQPKKQMPVSVFTTLTKIRSTTESTFIDNKPKETLTINESKKTLTNNKPKETLATMVEKIISEQKTGGKIIDDYDSLSANEARKLAEAEARQILAAIVEKENKESSGLEEDNEKSNLIKETHKVVHNNNSQGGIEEKSKKVADVTVEAEIKLTKSPSKEMNANDEKGMKAILKDKITTHSPLITSSTVLPNTLNTFNILHQPKSFVSLNQLILPVTTTTTLKPRACRSLNAVQDGRPHARTDKSCRLAMPGLPADKKCMCKYLVGARDSNHCPVNFLYLCKRVSN